MRFPYPTCTARPNPPRGGAASNTGEGGKAGKKKCQRKCRMVEEVPSTLTSINNQAGVLRNQGQLRRGGRELSYLAWILWYAIQVLTIMLHNDQPLSTSKIWGGTRMIFTLDA